MDDFYRGSILDRGVARMDVVGEGKRVRIYIGESDQRNGRPLFMSVLEMLSAEGCAGATVLRGVAGFGAGSRIHTAAILRLSEDLPVVIEWIDRPDRVERVLPMVTALAESGLITIEDIHIVHYRHRPVHEIGSKMRVHEVMTRDAVAIHPDNALRTAVELLLDRSYRALPVVDQENRVVGIVTNSDLVERGGLRVRIEMLGVLSPEAIIQEIQDLGESRTVAEVMTRDIVTIGPDATLADAAHKMVARGVKRLPVVDAGFRLLGMISRVDLLGSMSEASPCAETESIPATGPTLGDVMRTDVPAVAETATLGEVLDAVISTRLNRAIVVDDSGRVAGIISDSELVRRLSPKDRPGVVRVLMDRLFSAALPEAEKLRLAQSTGSTARELMDTRVPVAPPDTPVPEAIGLMLREHRKVLPVAGVNGRFLGAVDRADLLRILASG